MAKPSFWQEKSGVVLLSAGIVALFCGYLTDGQTTFEVSITFYLVSLVLMLYGVRSTIENIVEKKAEAEDNEPVVLF